MKPFPVLMYGDPPWNTGELVFVPANDDIGIILPRDHTLLGEKWVLFDIEYVHVQNFLRSLKPDYFEFLIYAMGRCGFHLNPEIRYTAQRFEMEGSLPLLVVKEILGIIR